MSLLVRYRLQNGSMKSLRLDQESSVTFGRDSERSAIAIEDTQLSRCHCRLSRRSEQVLVEDTASSNGTWLNGEKIGAPVELVDGDVVTIGGVQLFIEELPEDANDPMIGRSLGDFEILSVLGTGSCGVVYRALQATLARPVAIKILRPDWAKDPAWRKAFLAEARNAGLLNHPNLIQVHDVLEIDGNFLMVMEYGQGGSVDGLLAEEGPFELEDGLRLIVDIGRALGYAHSKGLVHRDVKPGNILCCGMGTYKLADLGIAARMDQQGNAKQRRFAGSPSYLAPEQACGMPLDGRADIYALGATAWHLMTGKPLYSGSAREVVRQQVESPLPDLRAAAPNLPGPIISLLYRMMAKATIERIEDANQAADIALAHLDSIQDGSGAAPTSGGGKRVRRRGRRRSAARSATRKVRRRRGGARRSRRR